MSNFTPISISFCCNDEYGNHTGVFSAVHIGSEFLDLENKYWNPRSPILKITVSETLQSGGFGCSKVKGAVKIGRQSFDIRGYKSYWGNLLWDCVIVDLVTAMQIIDHLKSTGKFSVECASEYFFDNWEKSEPIVWTNERIDELKRFGYQRP